MNYLNTNVYKDNIFNLYAAYYDLLYADKNYKAESDYIQNIIKKYSSNALYILDLGCGTGCHALMLAEKGFYIHGIDISENMIARAREKKQLNKAVKQFLKFDVGDIRNVNLNSKFDVAVSVFHVASYLTKNRDIKAFLLTAAKHLNKNGILIFDFWYGPAVLVRKPNVKIKRLENDFYCITRISEPVQHLNDNIVDVNFNIFVRSKKENFFNDFKEVHCMRYFFKPELELFAEYSGFEILNIEEWLTGEQPSENSWGVCIVCRKI